MDYRITWSPEALEDIESIAKYIERDSAFYAKAVVTKIISSVKNIKSFSLTGRVVPELEQENIREIFVFSYRIIYQISDNSILIIAVIHGHRLLDDFQNRF